jgi:hypothetical protein
MILHCKSDKLQHVSGSDPWQYRVMELVDTEEQQQEHVDLPAAQRPCGPVGCARLLARCQLQLGSCVAGDVDSAAQGITIWETHLEHVVAKHCAGYKTLACGRVATFTYSIVISVGHNSDCTQAIR